VENEVRKLQELVTESAAIGKAKKSVHMERGEKEGQGGGIKHKAKNHMRGSLDSRTQGALLGRRIKQETRGEKLEVKEKEGAKRIRGVEKRLQRGTRSEESSMTREGR